MSDNQPPRKRQVRSHAPIAGKPLKEQDIDEDDPLYFLAKKTWDVEKIYEQMYKPILEAHTEWTEYDGYDNKHLRWECPNCDRSFSRPIREGTIRCPECYRTLQSENYDVDPRSPDPKNPDWHLEALARRRGKYPDHYIEDEPETESPLSW